MSILSNKGRVIPSLDNYANPAGGDLLIVQDMASNQTKNITFSQISTTLVGLFQGDTVNFTSTDNKFTGSFSGGFANFSSYLTALNGKLSVKGTAFSATGFATVVLGGTSTITLNSPTVVVGQILNVGGLLTASGGVAGNLTGNVTGNLTGTVTGDVKGDIYDNGGTQKILDNRTNRTALFRGSSSYASRSLSSSHALVADVTYTCLSHTTTADFATSARSASYASQSRSSSYLRYTGIPNGSSSYALKAGYALSAKSVVDVPNSALTASFLLWNATAGKNNGSASYAYTASYAKSGSYARTASYLTGTAGVIKSANFVQYTTAESGTGTALFNTGLSITVTPNSSTTKFLINASIVLANGTAPGNAIAGLWKLQSGVYTALIDQFTSVDGSQSDAHSSSTTYLDTAGSTTPRTYLVRVKGSDASPGGWYTNQSQTGPGTYLATSAMTILELLI